MKNIMMLALFLFSNLTLAKNEKAITEITFSDKYKTHQYSLWKSSGKQPTYKLVVMINKKDSKTKILSTEQAQFIRNKATRIIWNSKYRMPASVSKCNEYAVINSGDDKAHICLENRKATGMTYGLLNSISKHF